LIHCILSYRKLLEFFFQIYDPTTRNRQGNDRGTSYRSAIFYTSEEQKRTAEETIAAIDSSGLWPGIYTDPFGHVWNVATHVEDLSPEEMERRMAEQSKRSDRQPE